MIKNDIHSAAQELIDRHGDLAIDIANDRAKQLELAGDWPAHALAVRVLTEVERLIVSRRSHPGEGTAA